MRKLLHVSKIPNKLDVIDKLSKELGSPVEVIGYVAPGHGLRGNTILYQLTRCGEEVQ